MAAWGAWYEGLGAGVIDFGNPFTPMAKSIASSGKVTTRASAPQTTCTTGPPPRVTPPASLTRSCRKASTGNWS